MMPAYSAKPKKLKTLKSTFFARCGSPVFCTATQLVRYKLRRKRPRMFVRASFLQAAASDIKFKGWGSSVGSVWFLALAETCVPES